MEAGAQCRFCQKLLKNPKSLKSHVSDKHRAENSYLKLLKQINFYECQLCDYTSRYQSIFIRHSLSCKGQLKHKKRINFNQQDSQKQQNVLKVETESSQMDEQELFQNQNDFQFKDFMQEESKQSQEVEFKVMFSSNERDFMNDDNINNNANNEEGNLNNIANTQITKIIEKYQHQKIELDAKKKTNKVKPPSLSFNVDVRDSSTWTQLERIFQRSFKIVLMDPPWDIGMNLPYNTMTDQEIMTMPIAKVQQEGFLFIWVANCKQKFGIDFMESHGYKHLETIIWVKTSGGEKLKLNPGAYLMHAYEMCYVGAKGKVYTKCKRCKSLNVISGDFTETSQKPEAIYTLIERLYPNVPYLEIFGREQNCRQGWVTVGNQLKSTINIKNFGRNNEENENDEII